MRERERETGEWNLFESIGGKNQKKNWKIEIIYIKYAIFVIHNRHCCIRLEILKQHRSESEDNICAKLLTIRNVQNHKDHPQHQSILIFSLIIYLDS